MKHIELDISHKLLKEALEGHTPILVGQIEPWISRCGMVDGGLQHISMNVIEDTQRCFDMIEDGQTPIGDIHLVL